MNGTAAPIDYAERLEAFRRSDAERDALVTDLIAALSELKIKNTELNDDLANETASRRMWQGKAAQAEQALTLSEQSSVRTEVILHRDEADRAQASNGFCLALVDGDGAIFTDALYAMGGKDGGFEAAHHLHTEIQRHLMQVYPDTNVSSWNIIVQVVLNLQGLANKLQNCGIIQNPNELHAFGRAFGLAHPLFSFIDVGNGKERADHKIRETLRTYLPIEQCKHVFFAGSHDNGYLPVLEQYRRVPNITSRLTLIETRPAEPGFLDLGLKTIRMPRIFRSDNLPASLPHRQLTVVAPTPATPGRTPSGYMNDNSSNFVPNIPKAASPAPSTESASSAANSSSWATIGKSGAASKSINIAPKKPAQPRRLHILLNRYNERVDPELPKTDTGAEGRFAERTKTYGKLCNNYHLTGSCEAGEYCDYIHAEKLTPGELLVLKHKARSRSCPKKTACRDPICTFGHHCKYNSECWLDYCYFADTHDMDIRPAKRLYGDGTEEWITAYPVKA